MPNYADLPFFFFLGGEQVSFLLKLFVECYLSSISSVFGQYAKCYLGSMLSFLWAVY